jgi:catechol-2,3-dioxygenase
MKNPSIARLGHVGIHAYDIDKQRAFYRDALGLQVTDEDPNMGMVFMSARPEEEHHEFLICGGRNVEDRDALLLQQVSFRCDSLEDVIGFYRRLKERGVPFDMIVSHGNAVGLYFRDPEGNRCEVYWTTPWKAKQPFGHAIDLSRPKDEVLAQVKDLATRYAATGLRAPESFQGQKEHLVAQGFKVA